MTYQCTDHSDFYIISKQKHTMKATQAIAIIAVLSYAVLCSSDTTQLTLQATTGDYATCAGDYFKSSFIINNYPVYINYVQGRLLAKQCASGYYITSLDYLLSMVTESKNDAPNEHCFGAFHFSTNGNVPVEEATWGTYTVSSSINCPLKVSGVQLVAKGSDNYADCDGYYAISGKTINGQPVYINQAEGRFIAYSYGVGWVITGTQWLDSIVSTSAAQNNQYNFGAYHFSTYSDGNVQNCLWNQYNEIPQFMHA